MDMRASFYNKDGILEAWECDKIEADDRYFDYNQGQGFINVKLILPKEEVTLQVTNPKRAFEYMKSINTVVETGVIKFAKDDSKEIIRNLLVEKIDTKLNCVTNVMENVYTDKGREKTEAEIRYEEIEALFR